MLYTQGIVESPLALATEGLLLSFQELNSIANQEEKEVEGLSTSTAA